jgi:hypothetical protein
MVQVQAVRPQTTMDEVAENQVRTHHEIPSDLSLKTYTHVLRTPTGHIGWENDAWNLLGDLD